MEVKSRLSVRENILSISNKSLEIQGVSKSCKRHNLHNNHCLVAMDVMQILVFLSATSTSSTQLCFKE